jgi:hypothetical protein
MAAVGPDYVTSTPRMFWSAARVAVYVGLVVLVASLVAPVFETERHRWTFTEAVRDVSSLGFATPMEQAGEWLVQHHQQATGGRALVNRRGLPEKSAALALAPLRSTHSIRVVTRCKVEKGHPAQSCGVVFRFEDARNHHVARVDAIEQSVVLQAVVQGAERTVARVHAAIAADVWQEIAVEVRGDRVLVHLNGRELIDTRDATLAAGGTVGLWAPSTCVAYFDELTVEMLSVLRG